MSVVGTPTPSEGTVDVPIRHWPAPLKGLGGAMPPAPEWFNRAIAVEPERGFVEVLGVPIEALSWGTRGKPGLLLLHGNGAHADWWSFIAPFFAADYRVTAMSWSGMGRSGHRETYDFDTFVAELFAVGEATGVFDAGPPLVVGHSFGGFLMMAAVRKAGHRFKAVVIVDTPFSPLDDPDRHRPPERSGKPHMPSATLPEALARFKLAPPQGCENIYIADFIARRSLKPVPEGWIWAFDPMTFGRLEVGDSFELLQGPTCPVALMWGDKSMLMPASRIARIRAVLPPGSPMVEIPDAEHHVMIDQPLGVVAGLRGLFAGWPG